MAFTVTFTGTLEPKKYVDSVRFAIGDNAVLTITDGDDIQQYAPHAWICVSSQVQRVEMLGGFA